MSRQNEARTFALVWVENADICGSYDTLDVALQALGDYLRENPAYYGEIAVVEFENGMRVGEPHYDYA